MRNFGGWNSFLWFDIIFDQIINVLDIRRTAKRGNEKVFGPRTAKDYKRKMLVRKNFYEILVDVAYISSVAN